MMNPHARLSLASLLLTLSCGGEARSSPPAGVSEFESVEAFAAKFNADEGMPRIVLLLSPT